MALVIAGRIVPLDRSDPAAVFKGRVFIDPSGNIERVTKGNGAAPPGFDTALVLDVGDNLVLPGLIDLHNHIGYNALPLWSEPSQLVPWEHHNSWTGADTYQSSISWPATALVRGAPEALLAYVQLRALVGGTSAIQGWPAANRKSVQVLRNVDDETVGGTNHNLIYTSTLTKDLLELGKIAQEQKKGAGFIYHCAEGKVGSTVDKEFTNAGNAGCLGKTFIGIHCSAIAGDSWKVWDKNKAGAVVWSPFSNFWLYGATTDVAGAKKQHVAVCVGTDWGPSGTKNVLGEVKVAKLAGEKLGLNLTDRELVTMVTTNPGDALSRCWQKTIGRLTRGAFGDVTVFRADGGAGAPWPRVVSATEDDVMLVVYDGIPRYGDANLMTSAANLTKSSAITIRGRARRFAIPDPDDANKAWSWKDITDRIDEVRKDPKAALEHADALRHAFAGPMDASDAPLELILDMPFGQQAFAGGIMDHADEIKIPPLPTLVHDAAFFKAVKKNKFHGGLLDKLAGFYP